MGVLDAPAIPKGSTVLVTGANGFVGQNVSDQFLSFGYNVRGIVRDPEKSAWVAKYFEDMYGKDRFELFQVADMAVDGAYTEAIKGVVAFVHTASNMSMSPDPNQMITPSVAGAFNAIKASYAEPGVKRFVLTSSSSAAVLAKIGGAGITVSEDTWNDAAIEAAWSRPIDDMTNIENVYGASKTQAEKEVWKYHNENKDKRPDLIVNTVLPNFVFGKLFDPSQPPRSSANLVTELWQGRHGMFHDITVPQYFIHSGDMGKLHVAAAISPTAEDQRVFGFADHFSWDTILDIMRKIDPKRDLPENFMGGKCADVVHPDTEAKSLALLSELGQQGWTSLEQTIAENVEGF